MSIFFTDRLPPQETIEPTWDDMGAGLGLSMTRPLGRDQMQRHDNAGTSHGHTDGVTEILTSFFQEDLFTTSESLIPPLSQSQHILQTPSPPQETQEEDDEPHYG